MSNTLDTTHVAEARLMYQAYRNSGGALNFRDYCRTISDHSGAAALLARWDAAGVTAYSLAVA